MGEAKRRKEAKQPVKELKLTAPKQRQDSAGYAQALMTHLTTADKNVVTGNHIQKAAQK